MTLRIIGGRYRGHSLQSPKSVETRPSSGQLRESFFNICQGYVEVVSFLDLFAGTGAMGLEALSRGASKAIFVDASRQAVKCIQKNIDTLGLQGETEVFCNDVFLALGKFVKLHKQFDLIFADPPYSPSNEGDSLSLCNRVVQMVDQNGLLAKGGLLFLEEAVPYQEYPEPLQSLVLKDSRKLGKAVLRQYTNAL